MGGIAAILSDAPMAERERRLQAMAAHSPYRGHLRTWHFAAISFGCQARDSDAGADQTEDRLVVVHGRPYALDCDDPSAAGQQGAKLVGRLWDQFGLDALERLDGEYALLIYDKQQRACYGCVSLMMTRPLYQGQGRIGQAPCLALASEIRQVALGTGAEPRLEVRDLVEQMCLGGPALDRRRTEYRGIERLLAPDIYRLVNGARPPLRMGVYWTPPALEDPTRLAREELPRQLLGALQTTLRTAPVPSAMTLSGGYDSGTLWAAAYADRDARPMPQAISQSLRGVTGDETAIIERSLRQTSAQGVFFVETAERSDPRAIGCDTELMVERIPLYPATKAALYLPEQVARQGASRNIMGMGAEACLTGYPLFIADDLRRGLFWRAFGDLMRFRSYYQAPSATAKGRFKLLLKLGLFPAGSVLSRLRQRRLAFPLTDRWTRLAREAHCAFDRPRLEHGFARGAQLQQLAFHPLMVGVEGLLQLNERCGVEVIAPFLHRRIMDFGLRLGLRECACGEHEKALLRRAARLGLGGEPPWPFHKVRPGLVDAQLSVLRDDLGPAQRWRLVELGVLDAARVERGLATARAGRNPRISWGRIIAVERFVRCIPS